MLSFKVAGILFDRIFTKFLSRAEYGAELLHVRKWTDVGR
jgi:hypothetical protein